MNEVFGEKNLFANRNRIMTKKEPSQFDFENQKRRQRLSKNINIKERRGKHGERRI